MNRVFHRDAVLRQRAEADHVALELSCRLEGNARRVRRAVESSDLVERDRAIAEGRRLLAALEEIRP